jgi:hypothetical protein
MIGILWGLVAGVLVGGAAAAVAIKLLGVTVLGAAVAYGLAASAGALVGLVAGKPIWARGARVEAGLKAFFGALLAAGLMFALRRWVALDIDLSVLGLGHAQLATHPALALPLVATALALVFEVDNLFGGSQEQDGAAEPRKRVAALPGERKRVAPEQPEAGADVEHGERERRAKR